MYRFMSRCAQLAAALILVPSLAAAELPDEYKFINDLFPDVVIDGVQPAPVDGFLELKLGADVLYLSDDGKYLLQGEIYDVPTRINLTETSKARARMAFVEQFGDAQSILFKAEEEVAEVFVFTDIDCGYCRKLHREMANYHEAGISIRYLFFPRSGPGSASWAKAEKVWCADSQQDAMTKAKNNEEFESVECDASVVAQHYDTVQQLGLSGTPALLTRDGVLVIGYRSADELLQILNADI